MYYDTTFRQQVKKTMGKLCPLFILALLLSNCMSIPSTEITRTPDIAPQSSVTSLPLPTPMLTPRTLTLQPLETELPGSLTITPVDTVASFPSLVFDQGSEVDISADQIVPECAGPNILSETNSNLGNGLMAFSRTDSEVKLWENGEFQSVANTKNDPSSGIIRGGSWSISPDGQWLLYYYENSKSNFIIGVLNIEDGNQIERNFNDIGLGRGQIVWGDEYHIIVPLPNEVDLFHWLVWNPFRQEVDTVSVRLPGIGEIVDPIDPTRIYIIPVYVYPANLVVYACRDCQENEYQAVNVQTGQLQWGIDLGSAPLSYAQFPPILSPTGGNVAIYFGENKLWILNDKGESILRIFLPRKPLGGGVASAITWSSDGKLLAFMRYSGDPDVPFVSVVSLEQKQLYDLCNTDLYYGGLYWSYDNQYLLHERYRGDEKETVYTILGIHSDMSFRFITQDDLLILGWGNP